MRWEALFADLEAEAEALDRDELHAEVADRTRREAALLRLQDRLATTPGTRVGVRVVGVGQLRAAMLSAGPDWMLLEEGGRELLVPTDAVLTVTGVGRHSAVPGSEGPVGRKLNFAYMLRALARDRAGLSLVLRDATTLSGTLDRVGADYLEVAEHPAGESRRAGTVRAVSLIRQDAIALIRSGG